MSVSNWLPSINDSISNLHKLSNIGNSTMMKLKGIRSLPPKQYVIKRLGLAAGRLGLVCATGGSGKTMLIQYIACCVASGLPLFGIFPVRKGSVVYIDGEQSADQTQVRYERIASGLGLEELSMERLKPLVRFDSIKVDREQVKKELIQLLTGKTLCVMDSLKKMSESDENSADIENILNMLKQIAEETNCAVLLIHHKGKGKDAKQSGRGHSSIYDSVDMQMDIDMDKKGNASIECAKSRDSKFFDGIEYMLEDDGEYIETQDCKEHLLFKLVNGEVKNEKADTRMRILDALIGKDTTTHGELYSIIKGDRATFNGVVESLLVSNMISELKGPRGSRIFSIVTNNKVEKKDSR